MLVHILEVGLFLFLSTEQIQHVNVSVRPPNSAAVSVPCGENNSRWFNFSANSSAQSTTFTLTCGDNDLGNLLPGVRYVLYRRYSAHTLCRVAEFTTHTVHTESECECFKGFSAAGMQELISY